MLLMKNNIVSIITVTYNCEDTLENTILSVINQSYFDSIEYIIIDGKSTDGTISIIKKYENAISRWISEPDSGIFDAMNKGADLATGIWVNYLNSGDELINNKVLEKIFVNKVYDVDILYGSTKILFAKGYKIQKPSEDITKLKKLLFFSHQSSFVKSELLKIYRFNTIYKFCADYDLFYRLFKHCKKFKRIDIIVANYSAYEGFSFNNRKLSLKDVAKISGRNFILIYILFLIKKTLKSILGIH